MICPSSSIPPSRTPRGTTGVIASRSKCALGSINNILLKKFARARRRSANACFPAWGFEGHLTIQSSFSAGTPSYPPPLLGRPRVSSCQAKRSDMSAWQRQFYARISTMLFKQILSSRRTLQFFSWRLEKLAPLVQDG